jgi:hypothetical protein
MTEVQRERAELDGELVTVLERGRRTSTIRTAAGFVKDVPTKQLAKLPDTDERKSFTAVTTD